MSDEVTPASEFRRVREQGERITLPSGRVVRMRVVKPRTLLSLGAIPDVLAEFVLKALYGQLTQEQYRAFFELAERKEQALDMLEGMRVVCTAALITPRIVDDPKADDEIAIDDLEDYEQQFIFDLAFREATGLSRFRIEQEESVGPVAAEQGAELPPEPAAGADG